MIMHSCMYKYIKDNNYLLNTSPEDKDYSIELEKFIQKQIESVEVIEYLPNDEYDLLLSKYIVFVDFLEC